MELLDDGWEYYVNDNCLFKRFIQLDKLEMSKVHELAKYDLSKLFEIYDQLDIKPELIKKSNFPQLESKIINRLKELKISHKIQNIDDDEIKIYLSAEDLSIIIEKARVTTARYENGEYTDTRQEIKNYVYLIKWNDEDCISNDHIRITEYGNGFSFAVKDKYIGDLFSYFDIPAKPKERYVEQNYRIFNAKPPKNPNWHETFRIGTCQLPLEKRHPNVIE